MCHILFKKKKKFLNVDEVLKLFCGGSVINGASSVYLFTKVVSKHESKFFRTMCHSRMQLVLRINLSFSFVQTFPNLYFKCIVDKVFSSIANIDFLDWVGSITKNAYKIGCFGL